MNHIPRLVIAGTSSGVGKTTVAVGIILALRNRGFKVAVFKCGPDYLDPTYLTRASETVCHNLDGWMMGRDAVLRTFSRWTQGKDIAVIEGMMGAFDGLSPTSDEGSTAQIAKWLSAPVLLVLDASGMARSIAAIAHGFSNFDSDLDVKGVICNRVGGQGHLELLRSASVDIPVVGGLTDSPHVHFPERHLGLYPADEQVVSDTTFTALRDSIEAGCDLPAIMEISRAAVPMSAVTQPAVDPGTVRRCRIGVAYDDAFHFYYDDNLRYLEAYGATLVRFSPTDDDVMPDVDGLYFGGGYPEIVADTLTYNTNMRNEIRRFAEGGGPIYAECGGLMYLCLAIRTVDGQRHDMVGVFPGEVVCADRLQALGYVDVETRDSSAVGPRGLKFRGHQFRYSSVEFDGQDVDCVFSVKRGYGGQGIDEGYRRYNVVASYVHAHWASNPRIAEEFVKTAHAFSRSAMKA